MYDRFNAANFALPPDGEAVVCTRTGENSLGCDVTEATTTAIRAGVVRVQFRLKFETLSDDDGQPDLARFFLTDPNSNQQGIFTLDLS
jgi:hypothetical protein